MDRRTGKATQPREEEMDVPRQASRWTVLLCSVAVLAVFAPPLLAGAPPPPPKVIHLPGSLIGKIPPIPPPGPAPVIKGIVPADPDTGFPIITFGGNFTVNGQDFSTDGSNDYICIAPPQQPPAPPGGGGPEKEHAELHPFQVSATTLEATAPASLPNGPGVYSVWVLTPSGGWSNSMDARFVDPPKPVRRIDSVRLVSSRRVPGSSGYYEYELEVHYSVDPVSAYAPRCFIRAYPLDSGGQKNASIRCIAAGAYTEGTTVGIQRGEAAERMLLRYVGNKPAATKTLTLEIFDEYGSVLFSKSVAMPLTWAPQTPRKVSVPAELKVTLPKSLVLGTSGWPDADQDGLDDGMESRLADALSPYTVFDSNEGARQPFEPVLLFQVHPMSLAAPNDLRVRITWVFLFRRDGGYGPDSWCSDDHEGDNDHIWYDLASSDSGRSWSVTGVHTRRLDWPASYNTLFSYAYTHPVIYMSAHKHHMYFDTTFDHQDSAYSDWGCNDDVNGKGVALLPDPRELGVLRGLDYANVGELGHSPPTSFPMTVGRFYPDSAGPHTASYPWGGEKFYSCEPLSGKWEQ
jgi:hypothetical protein